MDLFSKVKNVSLKAAQQGINLIQSVTTVAHDMGIAPPSFTSVPKKPIDDFLFRFQSVLQILDHLSKLETSNSCKTHLPSRYFSLSAHPSLQRNRKSY